MGAGYERKRVATEGLALRGEPAIKLVVTIWGLLIFF